MHTNNHQQEIADKGFTILDNVFTPEQVDAILDTINNADSNKPTFRKTAGLFAIRQFLKEVPEVIPLIFTERLKVIIKELFGDGYFVVKSIYFDKPEGSNWFVAYHQDLTISVDSKHDIDGYGPWTLKQDQYAVQPPLSILEDNFTIRIHLDDTDEHNGALRVVPESQRKGVYRAETIDWNVETETTCRVAKGGIMVMKPLLLHASGRSTNSQKRRVIHVELSRQVLAVPLRWAEKQIIYNFS